MEKSNFGWMWNLRFSIFEVWYISGGIPGHPWAPDSIPISIFPLLLYSGPAECAERLNTASPLSGLSRVRGTKQKHPTTAESVPASAKRSMRPPRIPPGPTFPDFPDFSDFSDFSEPPVSSIFLAFCCLLLYEADSDTLLLRILLYEADVAPFLLLILLYEADSAAILFVFCYMRQMLLLSCS